MASVNEHDCDAGALHVTSAIVRLVTDTEERGGKFQRLTVLKEGA